MLTFVLVVLSVRSRIIPKVALGTILFNPPGTPVSKRLLVPGYEKIIALWPREECSEKATESWLRWLTNTSLQNNLLKLSCCIRCATELINAQSEPPLPTPPPVLPLYVLAKWNKPRTR